MKNGKFVDIISENGKMTAFICGEIDHHSSKKIREEIDRALCRNSPDKLTLDLSGVTFMDSSGLGLILGRYKKTESAGISFSVTGASERASQMFSMVGLERLIKFE